MLKIIVTPVIGDSRFKSWTKTLRNVDTSKSNGYAFEGDFIRGKQELELGSFILAWGMRGSRAHNSPIVEVYEVTSDGLKRVYEKSQLDIHWTLDVRDEIATIVNTKKEDK